MTARSHKVMKRYAIHHIPLAFLFVPTLLAVIACFVFFNQQLQARFSQQLDSHAHHILQQVSQMTTEPLLSQRYAELKQRLWSFAQKSTPGIENIVVYDAAGELVTALSLDEHVVESRLAELPEQKLYSQDGLYHAWGSVDFALLDPDAVELSDAAGYLWVTFNFESYQLDNQRNLLVVCAIALLALFSGALLWRYRYTHFNRQLVLVNESLVNLNKGYKHVKLPDIKGYRELNLLQQQLNALVGFFEKRLTMKQFEVTALEQTLSGQNDKNNALGEQILGLQELLEKSKHQSSTLASDMYGICHQNLQAQLAVIENVVNDRNVVDDHQCTEEQTAQITDALNHLNQMLSELKVLCDVVKGQGRAQLDYVAIDQLIASVLLLVRPLARAKGLEFIVARPAEDIDIEVDVNQLQKVLFAVLQSAVAATAKGYIKLTLEVVELEQQDESGNTHTLVCQILDTGCGLSQLRYGLLSNDEVDAQLAEDEWILWGLNLMVAKKTVESMLGQFNVKSLSGLGAQFSVELPCRANYQTLVDMDGFVGCRTLLFDPVVQSAEPVIDMLGDIGMEVVYCRDEQQLKRALKTQVFATVLFSRPCTEHRQAEFDEIFNQLSGTAKLSQGLLLAECGQIDVPQNWLCLDKPFKLSAFAGYYRQHLNSGGCGETVSAGLPSTDKIDILAVDDNETNLKLLSVILRDYPVKLTTALSGKNALELCRTGYFDIILMDKEMPEMDGLQTFKNVRQLPQHEQTPVVMFSAHLAENEKKLMMEQQVSDCMEKPLDQDKFYYLMENWCSQRWQQIHPLG